MRICGRGQADTALARLRSKHLSADGFAVDQNAIAIEDISANTHAPTFTSEENRQLQWEVQEVIYSNKLGTLANLKTFIIHCRDSTG